ncbi:flavin reductase family protein [Conexibacter sp. JD483]|uniref:flavin reductase family protein n=1 Tax=unclassified Conexibacter TaxID=2627773 RepID=UPI00271E51D3|nr:MULTISPECIES: flavin reductase family protein [unclassified Conexibacter]MDO8188770.1 flavin reductase family protein [Conexibacter sp. CPCC 205706]MDO8201719.1 flavin reductase family protein [Conexibacter sp. CPCC 205762]MDR9371380.1 flavin reductase family protein [Conexibacter sp. JD483]
MPPRSLQTTFAQLYAEVDATMLIVTCAAGGERAGCLVGFSTQTSIDPPRFLACISRENHTFRVAAQAQTLLVHLVDEQAADLAELFGGESGDSVDKFARVAWRPGPGGAPLLERLPTWFAGRVLERIALGDHSGFLLEPIEGAAGRGEQPLRFHRARAIRPGHAP